MNIDFNKLYLLLRTVMNVHGSNLEVDRDGSTSNMQGTGREKVQGDQTKATGENSHLGPLVINEQHALINVQSTTPILAGGGNNERTNLTLQSEPIQFHLASDNAISTHIGVRHKVVKLITNKTLLYGEDLIHALGGGEFQKLIEKYGTGFKKVQFSFVNCNTRIVVSENSDVSEEHGQFAITSKLYDITDDNTHIQSVCDNLLENYFNKMTEATNGSGWVMKGVDKMEITFSNNKRSVRCYLNKYTEWPRNVAGKYNVININTDTDCVRYSMVAHFMWQAGKLKKKFRSSLSISEI